ncbi:MAG: PfkB family carbohydrate kinase [Brevinematales bacterium]|nr:PfkB family carbohydrate kinase [Brevinematales bacterium]
MAIVVVGSLAYDSVETPRGKRERMLGGSVTHFSNAASFLSRPYIVGVVGQDFSEASWSFLKQKTRSYQGVLVRPGKTFFWEGVYSGDMNEAMTKTTELGVFAEFEPYIPQKYPRRGILFLANIDPKIQKKVALQMPQMRWKFLDTMNFWITTKPKELDEVLQLVNGLIVNEGEAKLLSGKNHPIEALEAIYRPHFEILIMKRGSNGVIIQGRDFRVILPAYPTTHVVDPTGAGDSFAGAFCSYLDAHHVSRLSPSVVKKAASYASVVASFCVEDFGVEGIAPHPWKDIQRRWSEYRRMVFL